MLPTLSEDNPELSIFMESSDFWPYPKSVGGSQGIDTSEIGSDVMGVTLLSVIGGVGGVGGVMGDLGRAAGVNSRAPGLSNELFEELDLLGLAAALEGPAAGCGGSICVDPVP